MRLSISTCSLPPSYAYATPHLPLCWVIKSTPALPPLVAFLWIRILFDILYIVALPFRCNANIMAMLSRSLQPSPY